MPKSSNKSVSTPVQPVIDFYRACLFLEGEEIDGIHFARTMHVGDYDTKAEAEHAAFALWRNTPDAHGAMFDHIIQNTDTPYAGVVVFSDRAPRVTGCYDTVEHAERAAKRVCQASSGIDWYVEGLTNATANDLIDLDLISSCDEDGVNHE